MAVQECHASRVVGASESTCWGMGSSCKAASAGQVCLALVCVDQVVPQLDYTCHSV